MNEQHEHQTLLKKLRYYFEAKTFLHVDTTSDKFYNGTIIEVCADFILFKDRFIGEVPVFFDEIETVEPYKKAQETA